MSLWTGIKIEKKIDRNPQKTRAFESLEAVIQKGFNDLWFLGLCILFMLVIIIGFSGRMAKILENQSQYSEKRVNNPLPVAEPESPEGTDNAGK